MTSEQTTITLKSLDRAAIIEADTGETSASKYNGQTGLMEFVFPRTKAVTDCMLRIDTGLQVDALKLLECRTRLYRRIKGGRR